MTTVVWDVDDIEGLAREVPTLTPENYHDVQARQAAQEAAERWPHLARMCAAAMEDEDDPTLDEGGPSAKPPQA